MKEHPAPSSSHSICHQQLPPPSLLLYPDTTRFSSSLSLQMQATVNRLAHLLPDLFMLDMCLYGASQVALVVKNPPANAGDIRDMGSIPELNPWVRKIPWRRAWQPTPVFLPGEFNGQRGLVGLQSVDWQRVRYD